MRIRIFLSLPVVTAVVWAATADARSETAPVPLRLSGPYSHLNLQVFLVHGPRRLPEQAYLTLGEAMQRELVVVHETGNVQQLMIENRAELPVFIQAGDIVKGGRQDRVLRSDMIVPPRSGKVPLDSFCVEAGRWSQRAGEASGKFSANAALLPSSQLRLAAQHVQEQGAVWSGVAAQQDKLNANLRQLKGDQGLDVRATQSASSLQLTLENPELREMAAEYTTKLAGLLAERPDAVGMVFAVNGRVSAADVYGRTELFRALWSKLLDAAVVEAISDYQLSEAPPVIEATARQLRLAQAISALLTLGLTGPAEVRDPSERTRVVVRETPDSLLFESQDRALGDAWVHRSFVRKVAGPAAASAPVQQPNPLGNQPIQQQRQRPDEFPQQGLGVSGR
jgi:hypothetical protein